jgi:hypothetical protein
MDHVAGEVDAVVRGIRDDLAIEIDLDQRGRRDLLVHHAERIDQEMLVAARHARRDMVEVQVGHAVEIDKAVAGREIDAGLPFGGIDVRRPRVRGVDLRHFVHRCSPRVAKSYESINWAGF